MPKMSDMTPMPQRAVARELLEDDDEAKCYRPSMSSAEDREKLISKMCKISMTMANEDVVALVEKRSGGALSPRGEVIECLIRLPRDARRPLAEKIADGINLSDKELYGPYLFEEDELARDEAERDGTSEEIEAAWDIELQRRMDELDNGTVRAIPYEEFRATMDAFLDEIRAK